MWDQTGESIGSVVPWRCVREGTKYKPDVGKILTVECFQAGSRLGVEAVACNCERVECEKTCQGNNKKHKAATGGL